MSHRYDEDEGRRFSDFMRTQPKRPGYVYNYCPKCTKLNGGYASDVNALNDYAFKDDRGSYQYGEDPSGKRCLVRYEPAGRGCCF